MTNPSKFIQVGNTNNVNYVDTTVQNNATYYYYIASVDEKGNDVFSASSVSATPYLVYPGVPKNLAAIGKNGWIKLSWGQSDKGTYGINGYNIYKSTDGLSYTVLANVSSTADATLFYSDLDATAGQNYYYSVAAIDSNGNSAQSQAISAASVTANVEASSWPMAGGGMQNRKYVNYAGPTGNNVIWDKYLTNDFDNGFIGGSNFVTASDSTLYAGDGANGSLNNYAINQDSSFNWKNYSTITQPNSFIQLSSSDSTLYIASDSMLMNFEKSDGSLNWSCLTSGTIEGFVMDNDGNIYLTENSVLYKKTGSSSDIWAVDFGDYLSKPVIDNFGNVIVTAGTKIISVNKNGVTNFETETGSMLGTPVIKNSGEIVCYSGGTVVIVNSQNGNIIVSRTLNCEMTACAINANNNVLLGTIDSNNNMAIITIDNSGNVTTVGTAKTNSAPIIELITDSDNKIYYTTYDDNDIVCLNSLGTLLWSKSLNAAGYIEPVIYPNGNLLAFNANGEAMLFGSNNNSLNLNASVNQQSVSLTWASIPNSADYEIYRSTSNVVNERNSTEYTLLTKTAVNSYTDNISNSINAFFTYRVFAIDSNNGILNSSESVQVQSN